MTPRHDLAATLSVGNKLNTYKFPIAILWCLFGDGVAEIQSYFFFL